MSLLDEVNVPLQVWGLRDNAKDLIEVWDQRPAKRAEFDAEEVFNLREVALGLLVLISKIEKKEAA